MTSHTQYAIRLDFDSVMEIVQVPRYIYAQMTENLLLWLDQLARCNL